MGFTVPRVLYVLVVSSLESVRAWRPPVPGVREVFHARFDEHAYPPHTHAVWTLIVVDEGDIQFALDGRPQGSSTTTVTVLPPHVVHDGRSGAAGGFVKRVLYLDEQFLDRHLIGHAVDGPTLQDGHLRRAITSVHTALQRPGDELHAESLLSLASDLLAARLRGRPTPADLPSPDLAEATRALLDEHVSHGITLQELAQRVHTSAGHVVRTFTATFAISPHRYLIGRRVEAARALLLDGWPAARIATEVGFYDQAHFTRHFRRHVGTTPGHYQRSSSRPDGRGGSPRSVTSMASGR